MVDHLQNCFSNVLAENPSWWEAESLLVLQLTGDANAKNAYVDECIRETTAVRGEDWTVAIKAKLFFGEMNRFVEEKSAELCGGYRIWFYEGFRVVDQRRTSSSVVFSGVDAYDP